MSCLEYQILENVRLTYYYVLFGVPDPGKCTFNLVIMSCLEYQILENVRLTLLLCPVWSIRFWKMHI